MTDITSKSAAKSTSSFYEDLVVLMTTPHVRQFCNKYMRSWTDIESTIMFLKLYESLSQYTDDSAAIVQVIDKIMLNASARRLTVEVFREFQQGNIRSLDLPEFGRASDGRLIVYDSEVVTSSK